MHDILSMEDGRRAVARRVEAFEAASLGGDRTNLAG